MAADESKFAIHAATREGKGRNIYTAHHPRLLLGYNGGHSRLTKYGYV